MSLKKFIFKIYLFLFTLKDDRVWYSCHRQHEGIAAGHNGAHDWEKIIKFLNLSTLKMLFLAFRNNKNIIKYLFFHIIFLCKKRLFD